MASLCLLHELCREYYPCLCRLLTNLLLNIQNLILGSKLSVLCPAIPLAIVGCCFGFAQTWVFALSLLGLPLVAERVTFLTEQVAYHTGPTVGGLLIATFGNAPELIIVIFALSNHKIDVVKYSLLGSIISNLLLVLGASLYHGGITKLRKRKKYDKRQANVNSYMLLLALLCHLLPMPFRNAAAASAAQTEDLSLPLSIAGSITMLIIYFGNLVFQPRRTDNQSSEALDVCILEFSNTKAVDQETGVIGLWSVFVWLAVMTALTTLLSKFVVETIEDPANSCVLPVSFLSIILLPTVGNAAKHNGVIISAFKYKPLDISLSVALGSATQIFTFVVPLCVTIAWLMGIKMDLNFDLPEISFLTLTIVAITFPLQGWVPSFPLGNDRNGSLSLCSSCPFNLRL